MTKSYFIHVSTRERTSVFSKEVEGTLEDAMREFKSIAHWQSGCITELRDPDAGKTIAIYGMNNKPGYIEPVPH